MGVVPRAEDGGRVDSGGVARKIAAGEAEAADVPFVGVPLLLPRLGGGVGVSLADDRFAEDVPILGDVLERMESSLLTLLKLLLTNKALGVTRGSTAGDREGGGAVGESRPGDGRRGEAHDGEAALGDAALLIDTGVGTAAAAGAAAVAGAGSSAPAGII